MSKQNYSVARVKTRTQESVGKFERHIERKNEHYANMNVDLQRAPMNVSFRDCGELTYNEMLQKLVDEGKVSMRGLKRMPRFTMSLSLIVIRNILKNTVGINLQKRFTKKHITLPKNFMVRTIFSPPLCMPMKST